MAQTYGIGVRGARVLNEIDGKPLGVIGSSICLGDWTGQNLPLEVLKKTLLQGFAEVGEDDIIELVVHPGFCDEELMRSSSWNTVRENDFRVLMQMAEQDWLRKEGIQLVRFPDLN